MVEWLEAAENGQVRWVDQKIGPGWWHSLLLVPDDSPTSSKSKLITRCGLPVEPPDVVKLAEIDDDDWVCDMCVEDGPPTE